MQYANLDGRLVVVTDNGAIDVATNSNGRFSSEPQAIYEHWDAFREWAATASPEDAVPLDVTRLRCPVPEPRQVLAVGLNYAAHAREGGFPTPDQPSVFTKFPSCLTGPGAEVELPAATVDWEVELVVVISRHTHRVTAAEAWRSVAGLTVGQDLSERTLQMTSPAPQQVSLAKSFPGFGPLGPVVATVDEFSNPDDVALGCSVNGEVVQQARTSDLIFSVPALIEHLSSILPLLPGDLIFTGTPSGVGAGRTPPRFLSPGDELVSWVEGVGELRTGFAAGAGAAGTGTAS